MNVAMEIAADCGFGSGVAEGFIDEGMIELDLMLSLMTNVGLLMHFPEPVVRNLVVLKQQVTL